MFRFILTVSHTFHLVHLLTFEQLQGSTGSGRSPTGTKDAVYTASVLLEEIDVCPHLPKYRQCHGEHEAGRQLFVLTYNPVLFSEVSQKQPRHLPVNRSIFEKFYCH